MRQSSRIVLFWALVVAAGVGASFVTRAQTPASGPSPDILPSLLVEVRGLRAAMEQMASAGPRVQLALGRLQLQEQRIQNLVRRLDEIRSNQESPQREHDKLTERIKEMTDSLPERDEQGRRMIGYEIGEAKKEQARLAAILQKLQGEEHVLNTEITNEQGRWTDFNQRLEDLERSLIRR